jgi:hypothetical protein
MWLAYSVHYLLCLDLNSSMSHTKVMLVFLRCTNSISTRNFTSTTPVSDIKLISTDSLTIPASSASPLQTFALGAGHSVEIPHYVRSFPMPTRLSHRTICNSLKASTWRADGPTDGRCLWEMHGVWAWDRSKRQPIVLREGYFARHPITGAKVRSLFLILVGSKLIVVEG